MSEAVGRNREGGSSEGFVRRKRSDEMRNSDGKSRRRKLFATKGEERRTEDQKKAEKDQI